MIGEAAMLPWLSADEIADLCEGLTQPAAQARFLAKLGIEAKRKPSGLFHALLQRMLQRLQDGERGYQFLPIR